MAETDTEVLHAQDFIDESGWTSMEPEGAGHHPHAGIEWESYIGGAPRSGGPLKMWGSRHDAFLHEGIPQRGFIPVEGDGDGAPE